MAETGQDFVRLVMGQLDVTSPAQLAEKMRWNRGTERLIAKWLAGSNDPSYRYTMEMLERCGWISVDGGTAATERRDPLESLAASVDALVRGQATILEGLQQAGLVEAPATQRSTSQARPRRKETR